MRRYAPVRTVTEEIRRSSAPPLPLPPLVCRALPSVILSEVEGSPRSDAPSFSFLCHPERSRGTPDLRRVPVAPTVGESLPGALPKGQRVPTRRMRALARTQLHHLRPLPDSNSLSLYRERVRVRDLCAAQLPAAPHILVRRERLRFSRLRTHSS
jgi:hypothetical protein